MSEIHVQSIFLQACADHVAVIVPDLGDAQAGAVIHGEAAAGTRAAQGMADLADHWVAVLPAFAAAGSGLAAALRAAAADYQAAEHHIAAAAINHPHDGARS